MRERNRLTVLHDWLDQNGPWIERGSSASHNLSSRDGPLIYHRRPRLPEQGIVDGRAMPTEPEPDEMSPGSTTGKTSNFDLYRRDT